MPFWLTALALRFALRQSLSWSSLAPAIIVLSVAIIWRSGFGESLPGLLGLFLLVYAMPHAVTLVIGMDRDHRLDQLRLSGLTPAGLGATLLATAAAPWLVAGGILLGIWLSGANLSADRVATIAALVAGSLALSLVLLALPRGQTGFDARLVAVGIAAVAMVLAMVLVEPDRFRQVAPFGRSVLEPTESVIPLLLGLESTAVFVVGLAAFVMVIGVRWVLRALARPASRPIRWSGRLPLVAIAARWLAPGFHRGLLLGTTSAVVVTLLAIVVVTVALPTRYIHIPNIPRDDVWLVVSLLTYVPLVAGAFAISTSSLADRNGGCLDLLRLSPRATARVLAQHVAGLWLPFVVATVFVHCWVFLLSGRFPVVALEVGLTLAILAPMPVLEGWYRRLPWSYVAPALVVFGSLIIRRALVFPAEATFSPDGPGVMVSEQPPGLFYSLAFAFVAAWGWIPWIASVRALRAPDKPPLVGWAGIATAVAFFAPSVWINMLRAPFSLPYPLIGPYAALASSHAAGGAAATSVLLVLSAPMTVDPNSRRVLDRWGPGAAGAALYAASSLAGGLGPVAGLTTAIIVAAAWWTTVRIQQSFGRRGGWPTMIRIVFALFLFIVGFGGEEGFSRQLSLPHTAEALRNAATVLNVVTAGTVVVGCLLVAGALKAQQSIAGLRRARRKPRGDRSPTERVD